MPVTTYMNNSGGLNLTDSPITIKDNQATGTSYNYDYLQTGAISKILAPSVLNMVADAQLLSLGLGTYHDASTDLRTVIRYAGTKIQTYDTSTGMTNDIASDTSSPTTDFLNSSSIQPVVTAPFNTIDGGTQLWAAGGGMDAIYGYTGSQITKNGIEAPEGSISTTVTPLDGGNFDSTGTYYYGVQYRKASTQVLSNVTLDVSAVVSAITDSVTIDLTTITGLDTTLVDQIIIWRSDVNGVSGFTTGSIIAQLASTATSYKDQGSSILDNQNTPREGNLVLDNSPLPDGVYKYLTTFKRRLITASESTIYLSDLDKPESFPLENVITIPSPGPITGLGVIGVPSEYTTGAEEYLVIFKEREAWVFTGDDPDSWILKFLDKTGAVGQSLVVAFNGFLSWIGYNGIFIWDGRGRPSRISRPINALFDRDGNLDKPNLARGCCAHYESANQVVFRVSDVLKGVNKLSIKMDTRLTALAAAQNLQLSEMEGIFSLDYDSNSYFAMSSFRPANFTEMLLVGDGAGFVYNMFAASSAAAFDYETKPLDMGSPEMMKHFKRVFVYLEKLVDKDLVLYFWSDYRIRAELGSKVEASMAPATGIQPALWDVALWDVASWDDYSPDISALEFNLHSNENNSTGNSLKIRFEQLDAGAPVRIHGFAIEWEPAEQLTTPTSQVI